MKNTSWIVLSVFSLVFGSVFVANDAQARSSKNTGRTAPTTTSERIETQQAAPERHSNISFDAGVSSMSPIYAVTVAGISFGGGGALTGIVHITNNDAIQILVSIPGVRGGFSFGVGGLYKRTVVGGENAGFHLGGGIGLGSVGTTTGVTSSTDFAMSIPVIAGAHFTISGTPISVHVDGGPAFSLTSAGGTQAFFGMGPASSLLGASIVYMF